MSAEARLAAKLADLGLQLPPAAAPKGIYKPLVVVGNLIYTSGHLPVDAAGTLVTGRLGGDCPDSCVSKNGTVPFEAVPELNVAARYRAAQLAGLNILASLRKELGSLDRVKRVVKVLGVVNCTPDFTQQPAVINGCSELFAEVFGPDVGIGARSAIGTNSLPLGVPVEIEGVFEV
jgi:enamine deaminase RidA (YjgF/YER057c/UK114 family)